MNALIIILYKLSMQIIVVTEQIVIIADVQIMIVVYSNHFL